MGLLAGQKIREGDFINTSAGAGDAGKATKLGSDGKLSPTFGKRFGCRAYGSSSTISHSGLGTMSFPSESYDDDAMFDTGSPTRITIKKAGYWMIGASFASGQIVSSGPIGVNFVLNGTTIIGGGGGTLWGGASGGVLLRHFNVNDYIEVQTISPSSSTSANGGDGSNFWAQAIQLD